jgi:hypothetical protein
VSRIGGARLQQRRQRLAVRDKLMPPFESMIVSGAGSYHYLDCEGFVSKVPFA